MHVPPMRADPPAATAVVVVVVAAAVVAHAEHAIPEELRATPGLSALLPRPSDCAVSVVWNELIVVTPDAVVASRISVDDPTDVCTYVAIEPSDN